VGEKGPRTVKKPLLIYDGDCHFCRQQINHWQSSTRDRVDYAPYQDVKDRFPEIQLEAFQASVQLIEPDGNVYSGAEAVFRTLAHAPGRRWIFWIYQKIPLAAPLSEWVYRLIARNRSQFHTYFLTRWIFLKCLGLIYLIAFVSLWTQVSGLVGANGILPAKDFLEGVREEFGPGGFWFTPTLCWLNASDGFLQFLCGGGAFLSLLLIVGIAPAPILFLLWLFYLSLATVCQNFLWFQWDGLLLETGFLAIFFAPLQLRPRVSPESPPSPLILWLFRLLLFKLTFSSGVVKLTSGDPTWRNLTALSYHYETQPLPIWTSWYIHQLPQWFQKVSVVGMLATELIVPFLIFAPRRLRLGGCAALILLQLFIMATGNYCFFNLLTIALCVLLLDDGVWRSYRWRDKVGPQTPLRRWSAWLTVPIAAMIFVLTTVQVVGTFRRRVRWPTPLVQLRKAVGPFRSVNSYGLFAVMTTSRPEIVVEGSNDGKTWLAYEFKHKPGDLMRRPGFVAPHQPRLDWQMWFAALGSYRNNPWFISFCIRLLEGSPDVTSLLPSNPFPDAPPRYIRAVVYDYHFTDFATRRRDGRWWRRQAKGLYCPVLSLRGK